MVTENNDELYDEVILSDSGNTANDTTEERSGWIHDTVNFRDHPMHDDAYDPDVTDY